MDGEKLDIVLNKMREDINSELKIDSTNRYYISIFAKDEKSLYNAIYVLQDLNIKAKHVILIPRSYKKCNFDCITISIIFGSMRSNILYNIDCITIHDEDGLNNGDFYISIIKENIETNNSIIISFDSLSKYIDK